MHFFIRNENVSVLIACQKGYWVHDHVNFDESIGSTKQWYCNESIYSTTALSINNAGSAAGTFLLPIIADKL